MLIVTDPRVDHQAVREACYVNLPVVAFTNTDSPLRFVNVNPVTICVVLRGSIFRSLPAIARIRVHSHIDIAIPVNNNSIHSVGLTWWLLAREVLRLRGSIQRDSAWHIMPDLYFFRDAEAEAKTAEAVR